MTSIDQRNDVRRDIIDAAVELANARLRDGIRLSYFGRDTDSGNARVVRYDRHGEIGLEAVGTPREMWQFLTGFNLALEVTNR